MTHSPLTRPTDRPFPAYPCLDRYFPAAGIEDARERLSRAIDRGDGPGLLVGASGTGKTLLMGVLATQFRPRFEVAMLSCAQLCTRRALLQAILFEMGLPYRYHDEGELRLTLLDHLLRSDRCRHGLLLLVDEAQSLPARLLEEIRLMSNLVRDGEPWVRVVLAGTPSLEEQLATTELETFQQRIATRCYLAPLGRAETSQYVRAHLTAVGLEGEEMFSAAALDAVFDATDGVPRLVNQLCDHTLLLSTRQGRGSLERKHVQQAWADLQQLPTPWETQPEALSSPIGESVVEFGQLAAEDDSYAARGVAVERAEDVAVIPISEVRRDALESQYVDQRCESEAAHPPIELASAASSAPHVAWDDVELLDPTILDDDDKLENDSNSANEFATTTLLESQQAVNVHVGMKRSGDSPRTRTARVPVPAGDVRDPFGEEFQEEEMVLENFASLGDAFGAGAPRVAERGQGVHFSTLVERALDMSDRTRPAQRSKHKCPSDATPHVQVADTRPPTLDAIPLITIAASPAVDHDFWDPVYPEQELALAEETTDFAATVSTIRYPGPPREDTDVDLEILAMPQAASASPRLTDEGPVLGEIDDDDDILVVDDSPAELPEPPAGVRRQEYSQLFANLRRM